MSRTDILQTAVFNAIERETFLRLRADSIAGRAVMEWARALYVKDGRNLNPADLAVWSQEMIQEQEWPEELTRLIDFDGALLRVIISPQVSIELPVTGGVEGLETSLYRASVAARLYQHLGGRTDQPAEGGRSGKSDQDGAETDRIEFKVTSIERQVSKGKTLYKVYGGPYSQFGVTCWPEVMEMYDPELSEMPIGQAMEFSTLWAIAYAPVEDGKRKVKKVIKIIDRGEQDD